MQLIWRCNFTAEEYVEGQAQQHALRPIVCPHCRRPGCLRALGYYSRGIGSSDTGHILTVRIRRFRCRLFGKTVSLLPAFAHPYRLVGTEFIERYFSGHRRGVEMQWWSPLLHRYWRRFEFWLPTLLESIGEISGLSPPIYHHAVAWKIMRKRLGPVPQMTLHLVGRFQVTILGRYRCHSSPIGAK